MHYLNKIKWLFIVFFSLVFALNTFASDESLFSCVYEGEVVTYHENEAKRMMLLGAECHLMGGEEHITCSMDGVRVDYSRREADELLMRYPDAVCDMNGMLVRSSTGTGHSRAQPLQLQDRLIIYFLVNSSRLSSKDKTKIKAFARAHRNMGYFFTITGYASATGSSLKNQNLSLKRAGIVRNSLLDGGVKADSILSVDALGEESLRYRTQYEEQRNRAVEIKAFK